MDPNKYPLITRAMKNSVPCQTIEVEFHDQSMGRGKNTMQIFRGPTLESVLDELERTLKEGQYYVGDVTRMMDGYKAILGGELGDEELILHVLRPMLPRNYVNEYGNLETEYIVECTLEIRARP